MQRVSDIGSLQEVRSNFRIESIAHNVFRLSIQRSATLPHDHVYGLLGLITEFFQLDVEPDYSSSLARL